MAYCDNDVPQSCADPSYYAEKTAYKDQETRKSFIGAGAQCGTSAVPAVDESYIIEQLFTYHPVSPFTAQKYETIREAAKYFAKVLLANTPAGADRTAAIRKLREAVFTANASIALGGLGL